MYILDIETRPQADLVDLFNKGIKAPKTYKDEEKIEAYIQSKKAESKKGMSIDPDYADILCLGLKKIGEPAQVFEGKDMEKALNEIGGSTIVTFNGKQFDFPLIIKYGIKWGLKLDYQRLKAGAQRFKSNGHIDLMEEICGGKFKSLDELLQIYLGIGKKEIDFATATEEEVKAHCIEDLENTEKLYNKFKPLFI